jgi:hypothetical protein
MYKITNPEILNQRVFATVALELGYEITIPSQFQKAKEHISQLSAQELFTLYLKWHGLSYNWGTIATETLDNIRAATVKKPPQRVLVRIFNDQLTQLTWSVRVVQKAELYGREDCLTYEKEEPLVEFYDTRYPHTNLGQFVSRYSLSTMIETHPYWTGLCLYDGVPDWTISDACFGRIQDWLMSLDLLTNKEVEHV